MTTSEPWTAQGLTTLRNVASRNLSNLQDEIRTTDNETPLYDSWVRGHVDLEQTESSFVPSAACRYFDRNGFLLVEKFSTANEISRMKHQMQELTSDWDPTKKTVSFRTDEESNKVQGSDDYFLESASRVHFFAEPQALNDKGALLSCYQGENKINALNKAGHGMHMIPGAFADYSRSPKVSELVHSLGWIDPVVPQSMYIFKQAQIGGAVNSHQDSTFLYTTPRQSCMGLWLALDDATLENGCLWVRPKSHKEPVRRQFVRNPLYFGKDAMDTGSNIAGGDLEQDKMIMEHLVKEHDVPWEGLLPQDSAPPHCRGLLEAGFIPVECKAGDLLAFCGELDHLSLPNTSNAPRHTFQLHLVEGPNAGVTWSKQNWLQYPQGTPFLSIKTM